jgi:hypothetical protein
MSEWQDTRIPGWQLLKPREDTKNPDEMFKGVSPILSTVKAKRLRAVQLRCNNCNRPIGATRSSSAFGATLPNNRGYLCLPCWRKGHR